MLKQCVAKYYLFQNFEFSTDYPNEEEDTACVRSNKLVL